MSFIRILSVIITTSLVMACSNDDDNSKGQGSIGILHVVGDAAQILIDNSNRNFGTYFYQAIGVPITVTEGGYKVDVVERDTQNSSNDLLLASSSFSVGTNRLRLAVVHGQIANDNIEISTVILARDDDAAKNDNEVQERYVNISNFFSGEEMVNVKLTGVTDPTSEFLEQLAFKATSTKFQASSQPYVLEVTDLSGTVLYKSSEQVIEDQLEQTIVFANYNGLSNTPDTSINAYYFGSTTIYNGIWLNQEDSSSLNGQLKLTHAQMKKTGDVIDPAVDISFDVYDLDDNLISATGLPVTVSYGNSSDYIALPSAKYKVRLNESVPATPTGSAYEVTIGSDVATNLSFYDFDNALDDQYRQDTLDLRALGRFATVEFQNLLPILPDDSSALVLDLHLVPQGSGISSATRIQSGLSVGSFLSIAVSLVDNTTYSLQVTKTGTTSPSLATLTTSLANGESGFFYATYSDSLNVVIGEGTSTPVP